MLFKTTPLCEQWRLTGGRHAIQPPQRYLISGLRTGPVGQHASRRQSRRCKWWIYIYKNTRPELLREGKGDSAALCKALQGYYSYQSAVGASSTKWLSWSFTTFCLYLIPVTHHAKTCIPLKSTFQTFGGLCNTTPVVAAWSASLSYF